MRRNLTKHFDIRFNQKIVRFFKEYPGYSLRSVEEHACRRLSKMAAATLRIVPHIQRMFHYTNPGTTLLYNMIGFSGSLGSVILYMKKECMSYRNMSQSEFVFHLDLKHIY
jgi:hypothetical protein